MVPDLIILPFFYNISLFRSLHQFSRTEMQHQEFDQQLCRFHAGLTQRRNTEMLCDLPLQRRYQTNSSSLSMSWRNPEMAYLGKKTVGTLGHRTSRRHVFLPYQCPKFSPATIETPSHWDI
jgi:hypothetical protein